MYFDDVLSDTNTSLRKLSSIFGPIINPRKRNKKQLIEKLIITNKPITGNSDVANILNQYFATIGNKLSGGMSANNNHRKYLIKSNQSNMFLTPVDQNKINKEIGRLKSKKGCVPDEISNKIIKLCSQELIITLS